MSRSSAERARIEHDLGIALDDVDLAAVSRAKARGASWDEVVEEVLVHETWFFRDPAVFDALEKLARERRGPLRILSAPCSTGEEAYSCAIALREAGIPLADATILGVDVSEKALARAEAGRYGAPSFRSARTGWDVDALGPPDAEGMRSVTAALRSAVRFRRVNLLEPGALDDEAPFDIVLCRNLVVYLTMPARVRIARALGRLVAPGGVLFLGHAEELPGFERCGPASALSFRPASSVLRTARTAEKRDVPTDVPAPAVSVPEPTAYETARSLADRGRLDEAAPHAERAARDASGARTGGEAYTLLGMIESARGRESEAVRAWQRALYLDPSSEIAAIALATALRARGETARADALMAILARRAGR